MQPPTLGRTVREIVTGHEGVVTGVCEYLWGCETMLVAYRDADGKPQSEWYDVSRLELKPEIAQLEPVRYETEPRGADKAPPRR